MTTRIHSAASVAILLASAPMLLLGCELLTLPTSGSSSGPDPVAELPRQAGWDVKAQPVLQIGDLKNKGIWNDPCVLPDDRGGYVMYMTSSTKESFKPPVQPFRAVSPDGVNWRLDPSTPLLDPAGTPYVSIETPSVVFYKGTYHMYYSGIFPQGQVPSMAIGHATSSDGITWKHDTKNKAVISATGTVSDWNGYLVAEPGAVVYNDKIYLYFTSLGARPGGNPPQLQVIGLATSNDGAKFDQPRPVIRQAEIYPPEKGYVGYSTPSATVRDGAMHVFYNVAHFSAPRDPQWQQVALHHAVSADGERDFRQDPEPILSRAHLDFPSGEVGGPFVIFEGDQAKMWFLGHAGAKGFLPEMLSTGKTSKFGIRLATTDAARFNTR